MKIKNKGKVYPSPPSSSSSSSSSSLDGDSLSVLKLLPASILVFISVLSIEDREVLAYLITRSIKTTAIATAATNASSSSHIQRKASKKAAASGSNNNNTHNKPAVFDCDCFDCYTSYWFKWDSSPHRELIHQAIEAFEDHLTNGESNQSKKNGKAKRRDKTARRFTVKNQLFAVEDAEESSADAETTPAADDVAAARVISPGPVEENEVVADEASGESTAVEEDGLSSSAMASGCSSKGLARKVLPDVLGLLNSRLWSLWCPNA